MTENSKSTDSLVAAKPDETARGEEEPAEVQNEAANDADPTVPVLILAEDTADGDESSDFNPYDTAVFTTKSKGNLKQ